MFRTVLLCVALFFIIVEVIGIPKNSSCPALKLKFGRVRYRQKGRFVKFMCNTGYIIAGEKYSTCHNGVWDNPMPKCVRASCIKVNPPVNGLIYPSHRGAVLNFFCKPGYDLRGANATYCDGYTWDNNLPACIVSNTKPALSCNFESDDLCGWNHDLRHDFDWTRMSFKTPSGHLGTGPSFDHTKGEGDTGYYMYIESSSRNENDTARLISPIYDKMNDSNVCFEFFYHMHGPSTGQLRVYLKKESDSWDLDPHKAMFWKLGNHGDQWLHSITQIGLIDEDFQIIIEGVRGTSYFSDIAIDDIQIISDCAITSEATTEIDITYTDDFQDFGSCLNRCDNDNLIIRPTSLHNCECDETCIDNNTCCPDYIALCVLESNDDFSTFEVSTTVEDTTTDATTTAATVLTSKQVNSNTPKPTEKKIDVHNIHTNEVIPISPKNATTFPSIVNATTAQPIKPSLKKPTLVFLTPSTPEVIIRKVIVSTSTPPTRPTIPTITSTAKQRLRTIPKRKWTTMAIDEILTVPQRTEDKEARYLTPIVPDGNPNPAPVKKANKNMDPLLSNSSSENHKIVTEERETLGKLILIITATSAFICLAVWLSVLFVVKRYRVRGCRSRGKMYGSSSDSQSDVRFLTSDEILDFHLAHPDDDSIE